MRHDTTIELITHRYTLFLAERMSINPEKKLEEFSEFINHHHKGDTLSDEIVDFLDMIEGRPTRWIKRSKI